MRRAVLAGCLGMACAVVVGCGSAPSYDEVSAQLSEMMAATVEETGLGELDSFQEEERIECSSDFWPLDRHLDGTHKEIWSTHFPNVTEEEAGVFLAEVAAYWETIAPDPEEQLRVIHRRGGDVILDVDDVQLSLTYTEGARSAAFQLNGVTPCANY